MSVAHHRAADRARENAGAASLDISPVRAEIEALVPLGPAFAEA